MTKAREIAETTPPEVPWRAKPFLADGALTELDGKIKQSGKTTWALAMVAAILEGSDFLGQPTVKSPVVWLSEQPDTSLRESLRRAGLLERDDLVILSYWDATAVTWSTIVAAAIVKAAEMQAHVVVVDTFAQFARLVGDTENNAGDAHTALGPLQAAAANHGIAILLNRHERKSGGEVGDAARGSTAIGGGVDVILSLRRPEYALRPNIRELHALSRFDETPDRLIIELTEGRYVIVSPEEVEKAHAEAKKAKDKNACEKVLLVLPRSAEEALTLEDVMRRAKLKEKPARAALKALCTEGRAERVPRPKATDGFRYHRKSDAEPSSTEAAEKDPTVRPPPRDAARKTNGEDVVLSEHEDDGGRGSQAPSSSVQPDLVRADERRRPRTASIRERANDHRLSSRRPGRARRRRRAWRGQLDPGYVLPASARFSLRQQVSAGA